MRLQRRMLIGGVLLVVALSWTALAALSRDLVSGGRPWIDAALAIALVATACGVCVLTIIRSREPRRALVKALAAALTIAVMIALLEITAALKLVHWALAFRKFSGEGVDYRTAYVLDEQLSFRRIPGLRWSGRPASDVEAAYGLPPSLTRHLTFTYDRWGYRNASEIATADVVLLGDSYVEGWYVSDDETVAAQLTARLRRPVASLAVAGYGTLQELQVLKSDALSRHPRIVAWYFFEGNDLYDDQTFENALAAGPPSREDTTPHADGLTRSHGWRQRSFVLNALQSLRRALHPLIRDEAPYWATLRSAKGQERLYFFDYDVPWTKFEEDRWAVARAAFEEGIALARSAGIHIALFYVPTKYRVFRDLIDVPPASAMNTWDAWQQLPIRFHDMCEAAGVPCVDLTDAFRTAIAGGELPYSPPDTHWSAEGHAIAADAFERVLRENGW